ncbi:unannotated protein [freshwater metagenome]|uniref:Unannotated protein n=1 Tax=freshwater metagenome TaxID=449393 RepID=A0A6J7DE44_9ZZZZ
MCDVRNVFEQRTEFALRATLCVILQRLTARQHEDNDQTRPKFPDNNGREYRGHRKNVKTDLARHERFDHAPTLLHGNEKRITADSDLLEQIEVGRVKSPSGESDEEC